MGVLHSVPESVKLDGKTCIVTGANSGIGYVTAKELARRKAHVIMACRRQEAGMKAVEQAITELLKEDSTLRREDIKLEYMYLDLASFQSVRNFVSAFQAKGLPLHFLINNAGIMNAPHSLTEDGCELTFEVNHLSHFLLTNLLLDKLKQSAPSKIINVSSSMHTMGRINFDDLKGERSYSGYKSYSQSKVANLLFTYELARRLEGSGVTCNAVHPGFVHTEIGKNSPVVTAMSVFARSPEKGAMTTLYVALHPDAATANGEYFSNTAVSSSTSYSHNQEIQKRLWDFSSNVVGF